MEFKAMKNFFRLYDSLFASSCLQIHSVVFSEPLQSPLHVTPTSLTMEGLVT